MADDSQSKRGDHRNTRREYDATELRRDRLPEDPLLLFGEWLQVALDAGARDATAMALATADGAGVPAVRIVLLKDHGPAGFSWFTDYQSQKGHELDANPQASAVFYWRDFDRQVRVSGPVTRLARQDSLEYFDSRPEASRFSAAASEQSTPVTDRRVLEARVAELEAQHPDGQIPMPERWGGYCLHHHQIEFWQGREGRLHDRFLYTRRSDGDGETADWDIERLQP